MLTCNYYRKAYNMYGTMRTQNIFFVGHNFIINLEHLICKYSNSNYIPANSPQPYTLLCYISLYDAPRNTRVPLYPGVSCCVDCGATLPPPEVKSCRIICALFKESILLKIVVIFGFKCFQKLLSMQFIQNKSF